MNNKNENPLLDLMEGWVPKSTRVLMAWETWEVDSSLKQAATIELWSYEKEVARLRAKPPLAKR